jgi:hypothetical protein
MKNKPGDVLVLQNLSFSGNKPFVDTPQQRVDFFMHTNRDGKLL